MKQIMVTVRNLMIFSSGLRMHLYFFIQQMQKLGYKVVCLGQHQDMIDSAKRDFSSLSLIGFVIYESLKEYLKQNYHDIAFLLEWEVYIDDVIGKMFHDHSIPLVQFGCGNRYIPKLYSFQDNQENSIFAKYRRYHSLFCTLPHHISSHHLKQAIYQKPSIVVPFIWNSTHIQCPEIQHDYTCDAFQHIYVMEPNYDSLKNCFVPLVAIIHLMNTQPHLLQDAKIHFLCSYKVKDSIIHLIRSSCKHPEELMKRTDIQKRFNIRDLIIKRQKKSPAIVISHQNKNELNYLYFDCLYAGIPLIHNSTMIGGCGYMYKNHDVKQIVTHLSHLLQGGVTYHIDTLKSQKVNIDTLMHTLDPFNPDVMSYMKRWCDSIETGKACSLQSWTNFDTPSFHLK